MDNSQAEVYKKARKALQLNSCNPLDWNGPSADEVQIAIVHLLNEYILFTLNLSSYYLSFFVGPLLY